jgi:hypothetical protein
LEGVPAADGKVDYAIARPLNAAQAIPRFESERRSGGARCPPEPSALVKFIEEFRRSLVVLANVAATGSTILTSRFQAPFKWLKSGVQPAAAEVHHALTLSS